MFILTCFISIKSKYKNITYVINFFTCQLFITEYFIWYWLRTGWIFFYNIFNYTTFIINIVIPCNCSIIAKHTHIWYLFIRLCKCLTSGWPNFINNNFLNLHSYIFIITFTWHESTMFVRKVCPLNMKTFSGRYWRKWLETGLLKKIRLTIDLFALIIGKLFLFAFKLLFLNLCLY